MSTAQKRLRRSLGAMALIFALALLRSTHAEEPSPRFGFVGLHGGVFEQLKGFEKSLDVRLDYLNDDAISRREVDLSSYTTVFFQHPRTEDKAAYCDLIKILNDDVVWLWTGSNTDFALIRSNVRGIPGLRGGALHVEAAWLAK